MTTRDDSQALKKQVEDAFVSRQPLIIQCGGSKKFYGRQIKGEAISISSHNGVIDYQPEELTLKARAGTTLREIEEILSEQGQMLSCEVPHYGERASFGGMIAAGLSGPTRPFAGSIADLMLGCTILNGKGETLHFGGKVMKNVAGYDLSRLMVGSLGCLGVILDATLKVLPKPKAECSFRFNIEADKIKPFINKLTTFGLPVSASVHDPKFEYNCLLVRFSAGNNEIADIHKVLKKEFSFVEFEEDHSTNYWSDLRDHKLDFFNDNEDIWRISLAPDTPPLALAGETITEWSGALRWLKTTVEADEIFSQVSKVGGHASLFRSSSVTDTVFQPLSNPLFSWHQQLKKAFDPAAILNHEKMYRGL